MKIDSKLAAKADQKQKGIIVAHHGLAVDVLFESGRRQLVKVKRKEGHVVGDNVVVQFQRLKRLPRKTELSRKNSRGSVRVVGANLDVLGIVVSPLPAPTPGYIDQAVISARQAGLTPILVINKMDIEQAPEFIEEMKTTYDKSLDIFGVSAVTGQGLASLTQYLAKGFRSFFTGITGVGKSSLLNAICPSLDLKVGELYEAGKRGCNTTTVSTLHFLPQGGQLVDTPGFNEFGLVHITKENLTAYFPGFEQIAPGSCKFRDCRHRSEPGCAVLTAVEEQTLSQERYQAYVNTLEQIEAGDDWFKARR